MNETCHPICNFTEQERRDYLAAVAAIARMDCFVEPSALGHLEEMCATLGIAGMPAADTWPADPADRLRASRVLEQIRRNPLRVALLSDVIALVFADARVDAAEAASIAWLAGELHVTTAEVVLIGRYVEGVVQGRADETLSRKLADMLAAAPKLVFHRGGPGPLSHPKVA
jgi:hypothetical protein